MPEQDYDYFLLQKFADSRKDWFAVGELLDTCLYAQDSYKALLDYFKYQQE